MNLQETSLRQVLIQANDPIYEIRNVSNQADPLNQQRPSNADFSSIQKLIRTPPLRKVSKQQSPFSAAQPQLINNKSISNYLKRSTLELIQNLRNQFYTFQNVPNFQFYFPQSKFPPVPAGQKNNISYEQKNIVQQQNTFRDRLTDQQIQDIQESGQFKVKSTKQWIKLPYIWKVNETLFKGSKNRQKDWYENLSCAHSILYTSWKNFTEQLPKQLIKIGKWPLRLFSLFVGKKAVVDYYSPNLDRFIAKQFWNQVMSNYYIQSKQWGSELWKYLDAGYQADLFIKNINFIDSVQYKKALQAKQKAVKQYNQRIKIKDEKLNLIHGVTTQFQINWNKMKKKIINEATQQIEKKYPIIENKENYIQKSQQQKRRQNQKQEELTQNLAYSKFRYYTNYLSKNLPKKNISNNIIQAIIVILNLMYIIGRKQRIVNKRYTKQKQNIQKQVKENYPVRSLNSNWYYQKVNQLYSPIQKKIKAQYNNNFIDEDLRNKMNNRQLKVFQLWLQYSRSYEQKKLKYQQSHQKLYSPKRIFQSTYKLLPPYTVFKHKQQPASGQQAYYEIIKQRKQQVTTMNHCWKFYLYCMRIKCWTINCLVVLFYTCWQGMFGIRCLFGIDEFVYDQDIDRSSGQYINYKRKPVLGHFSKVLQGISKSRTQFQELPDTGLFGKNCSRICNLLECYIFRFLIVGIFITLILYPIAIIVVSILAFLLIVTVWAWIPLVLLVTYLFNVFIYQFQSSYQPYQCWARFVPFLSLIISLLFSIVKVIFYTLVLILFAPLLCCLLVIYSCLCRFLRSIFDCIMLFFIRHLGRTPSRDTIIAKKISGPGMSKQYYMSINEQDLYILMQAQLQKLYLVQLNRITFQKLNAPIKTFNQTMNAILSPLLLKPKLENIPRVYHVNYRNANYQQYNDLNYPYQQANQNLVNLKSDNPIYSSSQQLKTKFNQQYTQFMLRYPNKPYNTRFTQDQINSYFQNTQSIVKAFINKTSSDKWIFQYFDIMYNDLEQLTRRLWVQIFQCGEQIFEPLQSIDQRFKLQDQYKYDNDDYGTTGLQSFSHKKMEANVQKVMDALQGQVDLKPRKARFRHNYNHNLNSKEIPLFSSRELASLYSSNSNGSVYTPITQPKIIFYPNLSIKQLIKQQQFQYTQLKEEYQKNQQQW